jgi:hypothetical protein
MPVPSLPTPTHTSGENMASLLAPRRDPIRSGARLRCQPNSPFLLWVDPLKSSSWEVVEIDGKPVPVPVLAQMTLAAGVNGVKILRQGETKPERAYEDEVIRRTGRGQSVLDPAREIPADCLPAGVAPGGYLREAPCELLGKSGVFNLEAWQIPLPTAEGERQRWQWDRVTMNRWRAWLVASGQVPAPAPHILTHLAAQLGERVEQIQSRSMNEDVKAKKVKEAIARAALATQAAEAAA